MTTSSASKSNDGPSGAIKGFSRDRIRLAGLALAMFSATIIFSSPSTAAQTATDPTTQLTACPAPDQLRPQTIDRVFVQYRYISGMAQPLRSEGRLQVTENRISWHMTAPFDVETIITPDGIFQSIDGAPASPEVSGISSELGVAIAQSLADLLQGRWDRLQALFEISHWAVEPGAEWTVSLRLRAPRLRALFDTISVKGCTDISDVEITYTSGDREVIHFDPNGSPLPP